MSTLIDYDVHLPGVQDGDGQGPGIAVGAPPVLPVSILAAADGTGRQGAAPTVPQRRRDRRRRRRNTWELSYDADWFRNGHDASQHRSPLIRIDDQPGPQPARALAGRRSGSGGAGALRWSARRLIRSPAAACRRTRTCCSPSVRRRCASTADRSRFPVAPPIPATTVPIGTALREAQEETGLDPAGVRPLAVLPELFIPPSGFDVTPVIAYWDHPSPSACQIPARPAVWSRVSAAHACSTRDNRFQVRHRAGYQGPAFRVDGMLVWGFTAGILAGAVRRLRMGNSDGITTTFVTWTQHSPNWRVSRIRSKPVTGSRLGRPDHRAGRRSSRRRRDGVRARWRRRWRSVGVIARCRRRHSDRAARPGACRTRAKLRILAGISLIVVSGDHRRGRRAWCSAGLRAAACTAPAAGIRRQRRRRGSAGRRRAGRRLASGHSADGHRSQPSVSAAVRGSRSSRHVSTNSRREWLREIPNEFSALLDTSGLPDVIGPFGTDPDRRGRIPDASLLAVRWRRTCIRVFCASTASRRVASGRSKGPASSWRRNGS